MTTTGKLSLLPALLVVAACSLLGSGALEVTATAEDAVAGPDDPAVIRVTARNIGDGTVAWGQGSSTCQLQLLVRVDGRDLFATSPRICTADLRRLELEPGASRTEEIAWDGLAQEGTTGQSLTRLPPGTYELRGAAGTVAVSGPVLVTLED